MTTDNNLATKERDYLSSQPDQIQKSRERVRRYREKHRRFDYVPSPDALKAIEQHKGLDKVVAGVIDQLILAGSNAISGSGR